MRYIMPLALLVLVGCGSARKQIVPPTAEPVNLDPYAKVEDIEKNFETMGDSIMDEVNKKYKDLDHRLRQREDNCPCK